MFCWCDPVFICIYFILTIFWINYNDLTVTSLNDSIIPKWFYYNSYFQVGELAKQSARLFYICIYIYMLPRPPRPTFSDRNKATKITYTHIHI